MAALAAEAGRAGHELQAERSTKIASCHRRRPVRPRPAAAADADLPTLAVRPETARVAARLAAIRTGLARLAEVRSGVDGVSIFAMDAFGFCSGIFADLLAVVPEARLIAADPDTARSFLALSSLMSAKERSGQKRAAGSQGFADSRFTPELTQRFVTLGAERDANLRAFRSYASPDGLGRDWFRQMNQSRSRSLFWQACHRSG